MRGQVKVYQKKIVARRRRRAFLLTLYSVGALALFGSLLSYVSQLDSISIERIIVEGNVRVPTVDIENAVASSTTGNYIYLFSRRNTFLYPKAEIEKNVSSIPAVKRVDISRRGLKALVLSVTEREEVARWCSEERSCYSLDDSGIVYAPLLEGCDAGVCMIQSEPSAQYVYKGILDENPLGKSFLPSDEFKRIDFFMKQIEGLSVEPKEVMVNGAGFMTISLADGGKFLINSDDDLTVVLSNIAAVISDKDVAPDFSQFLKSLDYIKFDSGNKIVYKMKY